MTITAMALVVCILLLGIACAYIYVLRKQDNSYQSVAEYEIEVVEEHGFRVVRARILNPQQKVFRFQFVPLFAHQFSDELLTAVAQAGRPKPTAKSVEVADDVSEV